MKLVFKMNTSKFLFGIENFRNVPLSVIHIGIFQIVFTWDRERLNSAEYKDT